MIAIDRSLVEDIQLEIDIPARIKTITQLLSADSYPLLQGLIAEQGAKLDLSFRPIFEAKSWGAIFCVLRVYQHEAESTRLRVAQQCIRNIQSLLDNQLSSYAGMSCDRAF